MVELGVMMGMEEMEVVAALAWGAELGVPGVGEAGKGGAARTPRRSRVSAKRGSGRRPGAERAGRPGVAFLVHFPAVLLCPRPPRLSLLSPLL